MLRFNFQFICIFQSQSLGHSKRLLGSISWSPGDICNHTPNPTPPTFVPSFSFSLLAFFKDGGVYYMMFEKPSYLRTLPLCISRVTSLVFKLLSQSYLLPFLRFRIGNKDCNNLPPKYELLVPPGVRWWDKVSKFFVSFDSKSAIFVAAYLASSSKYFWVTTRPNNPGISGDTDGSHWVPLINSINSIHFTHNQYHVLYLKYFEIAWSDQIEDWRSAMTEPRDI